MRLSDAACHDCCARWTESGAREHDLTCADHDPRRQKPDAGAETEAVVSEERA